MYYIAHILQGPIVPVHQSIVADIVTTFGVYNVSERSVPHLTLKAPFEATYSQLQEVHTILKDFVTSQKPSPIRLRGFGHFDRDVIYINVEPSPETQQTVDEFLKLFKDLHWMSFTSYDKQPTLYTSLTRKDVALQFDAIWQYVQNFTIDYEASLDNIAIVEKTTKRRHNIRSYPFMA